MNKNSARIIFVIVLIAILASLMAACSPSEIIHSAANAAYSGSDPATKQTVNASPRLEGCSLSERQGIINRIQGDEGLTVDEYLDSQMLAFDCIAGY